VGQPVRRKEDRRLLTGAGRYLDDLQLPGTLQVAFVRSPHPHARIMTVDASAALQLPGVVAVLAGAEAAALAGPIQAVRQVPAYHETRAPLIARDRVLFVGQIVAAVIARSRALAEDAADLVSVAYEPLAPVLDPRAAMAEGAPPLHPDLPSNVVWAGSFQDGDIDQVLRDAEVTIAETFRTARHTGSPIETRGSLARWDAGTGTLELRSSTQIPHQVRAAVARCLALPESRVRVVAPDVGGGFGVKGHVFPEEVLVGALARQLGAPVKWVEGRRENLLASIHARDEVVEATLAATRDGRILGLRVEVLSDAGAYASFPFPANVEAAMTPRMLPAGYTFPTFAFTSRAVLTNKCPLGIYRGVGQPVSNFVMERLVDRLAARIGLDPAEVRLKNLVRSDALPFTNAAGQTIDSGSYVESPHRALQAADYAGLRAEQRARRAAGSARRLGIGLSVFAELCAPGTRTYLQRGMHDVPGLDVATLQLDASGTLEVRSSACAIGQGPETAFAQLAAAELGLGLDDVVVRLGDTAVAPYGQGSVASRGATAGGGAVILAARALREKILRIAAGVLETDAADLVLRDGRVQVIGSPGRSVSLADIGRLAHVTPYFLPPDVEPGLQVTRYYDPLDITFSNGVHLVAVEVDVETGGAQLRRYVAVEDCGTVINAAIVDGQVLGGLCNGVGEALFEELLYDGQGQLLVTSLLDYPLPRAADMPRVQIEHLCSPSPKTVLGIKGVGESGIIPAGAAIANALADAVDPWRCRIRQLPVTAERLWRAAQEAREA
jgi:carbon-monoxide dehydrogenase large subunit